MKDGGEQTVFKNLEAEMARENVSTFDIARVIKKTERTVRNKMDGITAFSFYETLKIRNAFFPKLSTEYLFAETEEE